MADDDNKQANEEQEQMMVTISGNLAKNTDSKLGPDVAPAISLITKPLESTTTTSNANNNNTSQQQRLSLVANTIESQGPNEPLIGGFSLLRACQLLNFDIYYIRFSAISRHAARLYRQGHLDDAARLQKESVWFAIDGGDEISPVYYPSVLDLWASSNVFQKYFDKYRFLDNLGKFLKIFLSLLALTLCLLKTMSNIILCLITRLLLLNIEEVDSSGEESTNINMGMVALILVNLSSLFILYSTVFNGHLIWNLLSRRLFLVSRRFQYRTMLMLLPYIYVEYLINISFVNNLYEWDYSSTDVKSDRYTFMANFKMFATEKDEDNELVDVALTIMQFARGIIRVSPYICVNYAIICLNEHIDTIRNQDLLTESLKKRTKLRLQVGKNKAANNLSALRTKSNNNKRLDNSENLLSPGGKLQQQQQSSKKRVNFNRKTSTSDNNAKPLMNSNLNVDVDLWAQAQCDSRADYSAATDSNLMLDQQLDSSTNEISTGKPLISSLSASSLDQESLRLASPTSSSFMSNNNNITHSRHSNIHHHCTKSIAHHANSIASTTAGAVASYNNHKINKSRRIYLNRIKNFDELESYITNLYIFTGRLNRIMSIQGLGIFFIVHNIVISTSVIRPEAIHGGPVMQYLIQFLMIWMGFMPFLYGESLNGQLEQLSKQIDRIIIQHQLTHHRRDNLIRIRELIHDIKVNCGGMLNFNVEGGIKYLVLAFASAFFIEQEQYKLTRRH